MGRFINKARREMAYYRMLMRHPETPPIARWLIGGALAYMLSPVDLIPDWIPVLGVLDDLVIVPGLIIVALAVIPSSVKKTCRDQSADRAAGGDDAGAS